MADDVLKIVVDYSEKKDNKIIDYETKYCTLKENMDKNIYEFKWYPYEEKIKTNKPYANWAEKTIIIVELSDNTKMKIEYYNYGVCDGLISFKESEYHFIPGLFDVYEKIVGDGEKYVS